MAAPLAGETKWQRRRHLGPAQGGPLPSPQVLHCIGALQEELHPVQPVLQHSQVDDGARKPQAQEALALWV